MPARTAISALAALGFAAWTGHALAQSAPAQQAQAQSAARAILGEWSFMCNAPTHLGFAEDTSGKLRRYYLREGQYRSDEEAVASYSEDKGFIQMKFASGEELTYKRSPEGIREWQRRLPGHDPMTKDGRTEIPVLKTLIDTPIYQRCK